LKNDVDAKFLASLGCDAAITIVHLIHLPTSYETHSKDYEFSRLSVEEHWEAGRNDVRKSLRHKNRKTREKPLERVTVLDLTGDGT